MPLQYETIKIETVNIQHFIVVNLKQLLVSAVQGSHHQAIYFRNVREEDYIAEETFYLHCCILKNPVPFAVQLASVTLYKMLMLKLCKMKKRCTILYSFV